MSLLAQELKDQGNQFFKNGKYQDAINSYTEALNITDTDAHFLYSNRAAAYTAIGRFPEAMQDAKKCIELKPEWSKVFKMVLYRRDSKLFKGLLSSWKGVIVYQ